MEERLRRLLLACLLGMITGCAAQKPLAPGQPKKAELLPESDKTPVEAAANDVNNRVQNFWQWFEQNSSRLAKFETDQERVFNELERQLKEVDGGLTFEFGPRDKEEREFVISADGKIEVFPVVTKLVAAAPKLPGWKIIAFRQPKSLDLVVEFRGAKLGKDDLWFVAEPDGNKLGLTLYIRGYKSDKESEALAYASFLLLDSALGEYAVETQIGSIERRPLPPDPSRLKLKPFAELPDYAMKSQVRN